MVVQRPLDRIFNLWALALTMLFVGCTKGVPSFESLGLNLPSPAVSGTTITVADKDEVITLNGSFDSRFYEIVIEAPELVSPRAFETSSFNTAASGEQDQYNFSISGPVSDWIDFDDKPAGYSETIKIYGQSKLGRSNESLITIIYNPAATAGPTVSLGTGAADPMNLAFTVNVTFTASVTGFDVSDVSLSAGAISNFLGSGSVYSFDVTPPVSGMGSVDVSIPALAAVDSGGNANSASLTLSRNYDWVPPAPTISLGAGSGNGLVGVSGFCENGLPVTLTDGFMIASTTCSGGGWSDTFSILGGDGLTSLTVSQTDGMGNSGSNAGVYNKDTTNPLPPGFPDDGIDYQSSTTTPSVNWGAGSDAGVGIAFYEVSVGSGLTGAAQTDVIAWMNVGNVTNVQLAALSLTIGNTYYFSVRAVDFLGLRSADVVSDGWLVVGPLDHFDVSTIDPATAGIVQGLFVVAKDAAGTTIRNYTGTVTFSSDDGAATLPGDYTFLAGDLGALNTSVRFTVAGTYYVRAQDTVGGEFGQQNNINILHAPAAQVVFTSEPVSAISGAGFAAVAVVQDAFGNVVTTGPDASASISLSLSTNPAPLTNPACGVNGVAPALSGVATLAATAGVVSFAGLSLNLSGAYRVRATKADTTPSSGTPSALVETNLFTVDPGPVASLQWRNAAGVSTNPEAARIAGQTFAAGTVVACDLTGNTAINSTDAITFAIDPSTNLTGDSLHGSASVALAAGLASLTSTSVSIYLSGTYGLVAYNDSTGATSPPSTPVTVSPAPFSTLKWTLISTWPDGSNVIPAVKAQIADVYGNVRTACPAGSATLGLGVDPGGTLFGTLTTGNTNCTYIWSAVGIDVAATTPGFRLSATTADLFCAGDTATCTSMSPSFTVAAAPGISLQHAIDLVDMPITSAAGTTSAQMTRTKFSPSDYGGTATYTFELVGTYTLPSGSAIYSLRDAAGTVVASTGFVANTLQKTRISAVVTFAGEPGDLRVWIPGTTPAGAATLYSAKLIVKQSGALETKISVPLTNASEASSTQSNIVTSPVDSTGSSFYAQGDPNNYSYWEYNSAMWDRIPAGGVEFEALAGSTIGGNISVTLWDATDGVVVPGTDLLFGGTVPRVNSVKFDPSLLVDGHYYETRIKARSGTARLYSAKLKISAVDLNRYTAYWRVGRYQSTTGALVSEQSRTGFDFSFSPLATAEFECTGYSPTAGQTANLVEFSLTDSGGTALVVPSSPLAFGATKSIRRSPSLTLNAGLIRYGSSISGSGLLHANSCLLRISK